MIEIKDGRNVIQENGRKATLVFLSGFGAKVVEVRLHSHGTRRFAQYGHAVFVAYTEKRKRKPTGITQAPDPSVVIFDGWVADRIHVPSPLQSAGGGIMETRHTLCNSAWEREADTAIAGCDAEIIVDYRGFNTYRGEPARQPMSSDEEFRLRCHIEQGSSTFTGTLETVGEQIDQELLRKGWLRVDRDAGVYELAPGAEVAFARSQSQKYAYSSTE